MPYKKTQKPNPKNVIQVHLKVLEERSKRLRSLVKKRQKNKQYNLTEQKRLLRKIKSAKRNIADAEFI